MKKVLTIFTCYIIFLLSACPMPKNYDDDVPTSGVAKVNHTGTLFGLREGEETPFADSPSSIHLFTSARGVKDMPAIEAMVKSGRVIFLPVGAFVDVLEHNDGQIATKVRIRSGANIGREMWTHPRFISPIN